MVNHANLGLPKRRRSKCVVTDILIILRFVFRLLLAIRKHGTASWAIIRDDPEFTVSISKAFVLNWSYV